MELILLIIVAFLLVLFFRSKSKKIKSRIYHFSPEQKEILSTNVLFYKNLNEQDKEAFETRMLLFLNSVQIIPYGCRVEDKDIVLIAASAIIPVFGFKNWEYTNIKTIYLLPTAFNKQFEYATSAKEKQILGMVGEGKLKNKMILSQQALHHGFDNQSDKRNTSIHEFIHLIDMNDGDIDGLPSSLSNEPSSLPWLNLIHRKIIEIDKGKSDIDKYGATSKVEFLAVAGEYFFERPDLLKRKHPELYTKLAGFFNQDLA